eukprot:m51a1_g6984 hypothetical protein (763) ;mRNA; f:147107-149395
MLLRPTATRWRPPTARRFRAFGSAPPDDLLAHVPPAAPSARALLLAPPADALALLRTLHCARAAGRPRTLRRAALTLVDASPHALARALVVLRLAAAFPRAADVTAGAEYAARAWEVLFNAALGPGTAAMLRGALAGLVRETAGGDGGGGDAARVLGVGSVRFCDPGTRGLVHGALSAWLGALEGRGALGRLTCDDARRLWRSAAEGHGRLGCGCNGAGCDVVAGFYVGDCMSYDRGRAHMATGELADEAAAWARAGCWADALSASRAGRAGPEAATVVNPTFFSDTREARWTLHGASNPFACMDHPLLTPEAELRYARAAAMAPGSRMLADSVEQLGRWLEDFAPAAAEVRAELWLFAGDLCDYCELAAAGPGAEALASSGDLERRVRLHADHLPDGPAVHDIIATSHAADAVGLLPLLVSCAPLLRRAPHARLRTDTMAAELYNSSIAGFVGEQLRLPLEAVELLLGLRLPCGAASFDTTRAFGEALPNALLSCKLLAGEAAGLCTLQRIAWLPVVEHSPTPVRLRDSPQLVDDLVGLFLACSWPQVSPLTEVSRPRRCVATFARLLCAARAALSELDLTRLLELAEERGRALPDCVVPFDELRLLLHRAALHSFEGIAAAGMTQYTVRVDDRAPDGWDAACTSPLVAVDVVCPRRLCAHKFLSVDLGTTADGGGAAMRVVLLASQLPASAMGITLQQMVPPCLVRVPWDRCAVSAAPHSPGGALLCSRSRCAPAASSPLGEVVSASWTHTATTFVVKAR